MTVMMKLMMDITAKTATSQNDWAGCMMRQTIAILGLLLIAEMVSFFIPISCSQHDDDNWSGKSFGMDSSAITAAQTEGGIKSKVTMENQNQQESRI